MTRLAPRAALFGGACVLLLQIPVLGWLPGILLVPMCQFQLLRDFCATSQYIEFGFAWIEIKSITGAIVYWAYYSVLGLLFFLIQATTKVIDPPSNDNNER